MSQLGYVSIITRCPKKQVIGVPSCNYGRQMCKRMLHVALHYDSLRIAQQLTPGTYPGHPGIKTNRCTSGPVCTTAPPRELLTSASQTPSPLRLAPRTRGQTRGWHGPMTAHQRLQRNHSPTLIASRPTLNDKASHFRCLSGPKARPVPANTHCRGMRPAC